MAKVDYNTSITLASHSLKEAETLGLLAMGMAKDLTVNFIYDGKIRVVEVHAIGESVKDGSRVMRGVQVAGVASRPLPQWTLFTVAKIENLTMGKEASQAPREGYAQNDKQMRSIICELAL